MLNIGSFLDRNTPSVLRNSRRFMSIPFKILFRDKAEIFLNFKERAIDMTESEFLDVYKQVESVQFRDMAESETDLSDECTAEILDNVVGRTVLEVGCGTGFLSRKLALNYEVTASDIIIAPGTNSISSMKLLRANAERLPFRKRRFDTVICAHTLEHIRDINSAVNELRRVTNRRLIVVVPRQRPFKYTFDLHLHFFPSPDSLIEFMGRQRNNSCKKTGYELFYTEDM
jgi:ubiquinone/menaquinone biosynthesis C-methylase UbiE